MFRNRRISVLLMIFALIFCFSIAGSTSAVSVPVANFTSNVTNGSAPLTVQYTDTSSGSPTSWNWNFGDGQSSTVENPTHTYSEVGNYNVTLNVTNDAGSSSLTQSNYVSTSSSVITNNNGIDIYVANSAGVKYDMPNGVTTAAQYGGVYPYVPNTYYIAEGGGGTNPIQLSTDPTNKVGQFTTTTNQTGTFYVVFSGGIGHLDDGILMLAVNGTLPSDFSVTLQSSGYTYTLPAPATTNPSTSSLTNITYVTDALNETFNSSDFIYGTQSWKPANTANYPIFNGENMTSASSQFHLMFIDLDVGGFVTNAIANEINDGSITVHYTFNNLPSTSFASFGAYGWFSACNWGTGIPQYSNSAQDGFNVEGLPEAAPVANFTTNSTSGTGPTTVQFTDTSSNNPTSWLWTFGDGGSSTLQNPTYTYNTPGTYNVTLTATNSAGNNTIVENNLITINYPAPVAAFTENTTSGINPLNVQFNDQSIGVVSNYYWTFGDGGTSTLQNPTYTYNTPGTYTVTETVTGPGGNNTTTQTNIITVFNSTIPNVTATPDSGIYNSTQYVVLSCDQTGSSIYYTTDGSNPQNSSTSVPYSAPIPISNTTNLQFSAVNQGGVWSVRYSKTYTIDTLSPTASSNLNGGTYNTTQTATLTSNDQNAVIYYTEDTTNPITSNTRIIYTAPINISNTTTLRYAAENPFGVWSPEYTVNYEIGTGGLANSSWPKFQEYLNNSGQSQYVGPQTNVTEWTCTTGTGITYGEATIGADGTIYIGVNKVLYALNQNGTIKWNYTSGNTIDGAPTIGSDGTIYIGNYGDNNIYAINPNGTLKWTYTTGGSIYGTITIGSDGTLYLGTLDDKLYAINPNGTLKWTYTTGGKIYCYGGGPAIGSDGTIYVGNYNDDLYAINPDGTLQWTYVTGGSIYDAPSIGSDGTIYVGDLGDHKLYAINPNGTLKWTYTTNGSILSSPTIGLNSTIYIGSEDDYLYALNPNGTLKWNYKTGNQIVSTAVIAADGTIYFGSEDDYVYALNPNGTLKWNYKTGNAIYSSPSIGSDGTLYIESSDTKVYAFKNIIPTANFTANTTSGTVPETIQFTDTSSNNPTSWLWNFGDGTNSTLENPTHTYNTPGEYTVSLTATNSGGNNTLTETNLINVIGPVADNTTGLTYNSIEAAVNAANNGDTILVSAGNYVENIILNKALTLEALGQVYVTPQDPTQPVFAINSNASGSTIEGFTISGSDNSGIYINNATGNTITNDTILGNGTMTWGICVLNSNGTNSINNNVVNNCTEGINLYNVDWATITNNAATDNEYDGIALTNSNDNTITNNNGTTQNVSGIRLNSSNNNTVSNNNLTGNIWTSISLVTSQFNQITNNTASNDQEGMYLYSSDNNTVSGNTADNNVWDGIAVADSNNNVIQGNDNVTNNNSGIRIIGASSGNQVLNNVVTGNVWADMSLDTAGNTTISGNTFTNSHEGIFIYNSNGNTVTYNTMNNDTWDGIYIGNSDNNTLTGNSMSNGGYGVRIQGSMGNSIIANNFVNNYDQAYDDGSNETWNNTTTGNYYNDWNNTNPRSVDGGSNVDQHPSTTPF